MPRFQLCQFSGACDSADFLSLVLYEETNQGDTYHLTLYILYICTCLSGNSSFYLLPFCDRKSLNIHIYDIVYLI